MRLSSRRSVQRVATVRSSVRGLLAKSPAFRSLPGDVRRAIARDMTTVSGFLAGGATDEVDFPSFVAGLIEGVFQAIIDTSIQQMEAYAALIEDIAKAVRAFEQDDDHRRKVSRKLSMGINRIVVTSGRIRATQRPSRSAHCS